MTGSALEIIPEVTINTYYLDTETEFDSILSKEENWQEIDEKWKSMKESGKYTHKGSPKSSSEYLIDEKTGDIYRYSNHWGRVASCDWYINSVNENKWDIAKSNVKKFKRKDTGVYLNPKYSIAIKEYAKEILPKIREFCKENDKYYLTDKAKKDVLVQVDRIFNLVKNHTDAEEAETLYLRKLYEGEIDDTIEKSKKGLPVGTEKEWGGSVYIKTASGWKPKGKGSKKKEEDVNSGEKSSLEEYTKEATDKQLEAAIKDPNAEEEIKESAKNELESRKKEGEGDVDEKGNKIEEMINSAKELELDEKAVKAIERSLEDHKNKKEEERALKEKEYLEKENSKLSKKVDQLEKFKETASKKT